MTIWRRIEPVEGEKVVYVGNYVLHWKKEFGQPEVGFVDDDEYVAVKPLTLPEAARGFQKWANAHPGDFSEEVYAWAAYLRLLQDLGLIREEER